MTHPISTIPGLTLAVCMFALTLAPTSWAASTYSKVYTFGALPDGSVPTPSLVMDSAGNLYGATEEGGTGPGCGSDSGCGIIFKLTPNSDGSWTENILYNFQGSSSDGAFPGGLMLDAKGNLYGTSGTGGPCDDGGCGGVFEMTPNSDGRWTFQVLFDFPGPADGTYPTYGLVVDEAGNLYGTTSEGGTHNCGTIYELSPNGGSWTHTVLYNFTCGADGHFPQGALLRDAEGNLYGTVENGGVDECTVSGCGSVYKLSKNANGQWRFRALYSFTGQADGGTPQAPLAFYAGDLYGTTYSGGDSSCAKYGCGVLFKLSKNLDGSWTEHVLHAFTGGKDGAYPQAAVIFDAAGNLYGISGETSGALGYGNVFKARVLSNGVASYTLLKHFGSAPDGIAPNGLMLDSAGNVYGTTWYGGTMPCGVNASFGCGVVFKIAQ